MWLSAVSRGYWCPAVGKIISPTSSQILSSL
jgi:hypothetical protein